MQSTEPTSEIQEKNSLITPPAIIRAETNFLRFPFFTLSSKNIHQIDSLEVKGSRTITDTTGESTQLEFLYRVSRNSDHVFPGQLSRKIHFALLSLMGKRGPRPENPISFTWRELAREMGSSFGGGKMIRKMKDAIRSTHGTIIRSEQAIIDGSTDSRRTVKRERGLHLYSDYIFRDDLLQDGSVADRNQIVLSEWYFANLRALYVAPIDFDCWKRLNAQTPVASRLYEYLVFVFGNNAHRTISYAKIAASIPLKVQAYESLMKKQLEPALAAMRGEGLLSRSGWTKGRYGDTMLQLEKGSKMRISSKTTLHSDSEPSFETTSTESLNPVTPSDRIISEYYRRRFSISNHRINANERSFIVHLMDIHGLESLERVLAKVASRMRREYPAGQTIAAAESFFEQELAALTSRPQDRSKQSETPSPPTESKQDRRVRQQAIWDSLSEDEKANLHNLVRKRLPKSGSESTGYQIMLLNEASKLRDLSL